MKVSQPFRSPLSYGGIECNINVVPAFFCILVLGLPSAARCDNSLDRSSATLDDGPDVAG